MADTTIGIEVDGNHATVVTAVGQAAASAEILEGASIADLLAQATRGVKPGRKAPRIRVSLVSPNSLLRRIDVTPQVRTRAGFEELVYDSLRVSREQYSASALFFDDATTGGDALAAGVAAVSLSAGVEQVYQALGAFEPEVVPPAFCYLGMDGLHLAVRYSVADITLVAGGRPVAHRQLSVGGLNAAAAPLDAGDKGRKRLQIVMGGQREADPMAAAELDRYLRTVSEEVERTVTRWGDGGEAVTYVDPHGDERPLPVVLYGPGAYCAELAGHLRDRGYAAGLPTGLDRALSLVERNMRPLVAGAYLAALSAGTGMPQAAFPDPGAGVKAAAAAARRKMTARIGVPAALAPLAALVYFGPVAAGKVRISEAQSQVSSAQARVNAVQAELNEKKALGAQAGQFKAAGTADPRWADVISQIYATVPPNVSIQSVNASPDGAGSDLQITVNATSPSGHFTDLSNWMDTVTSKLHATNVQTPGFSAGATTSYELRFNLPASEFAAPAPTVPEGNS